MITRMHISAVALALALAACGGSSDYAKDGDTGAAAPATVITPDAPGGPDSTTGISQRAGAPGAAGTRQATNGDSGIRTSSPASATSGTGSQTPKRP